MIIPVTLKPPSEGGRKLPPQLANLGNGDLVLIELQGSLEVQGSADTKIVGTLEIDPKTNKPSLAIGPHLLEGKIVSLPTPLAIMTKKSPSNDEMSGMDGDEDENREDAGVEWQISAIVKKKVVFATRPMPVLNRPVSKIGKK